MKSEQDNKNCMKQVDDLHSLSNRLSSLKTRLMMDGYSCDDTMDISKAKDVISNLSQKKYSDIIDECTNVKSHPTIEDVKKQIEIVKRFDIRSKMVFDAIHDENESLANEFDMYKTIGCSLVPRCGDTYVSSYIDEDNNICLKYYDSHYDSYEEDYVIVPTELFTFTTVSEIKDYWCNMKRKEYQNAKKRIEQEEEARKRKQKELKKKAKMEEYETYLKLKKKYEKTERGKI